MVAERQRSLSISAVHGLRLVDRNVSFGPLVSGPCTAAAPVLAFPTAQSVPPISTKVPLALSLATEEARVAIAIEFLEDARREMGDIAQVTPEQIAALQPPDPHHPLIDQAILVPNITDPGSEDSYPVTNEVFMGIMHAVHSWLPEALAQVGADPQLAETVQHFHCDEDQQTATVNRTIYVLGGKPTCSWVHFYPTGNVA